MTDTPPANLPSASSIPADDLGRVLTVADPDSAGVPHISVAGGTNTVLVSGVQTAGRYCLVDIAASRPFEAFLTGWERNILNRECVREEGCYGSRMTWMQRSFRPSCIR